MSKLIELVTSLNSTVIFAILGFVGFTVMKSQRTKIKNQKKELEVRKEKEKVQVLINKRAGQILDKADRNKSDWEGKAYEASRKGGANALVDFFNELYKADPNDFGDS